MSKAANSLLCIRGTVHPCLFVHPVGFRVHPENLGDSIPAAIIDLSRREGLINQLCLILDSYCSRTKNADAVLAALLGEGRT